jgi:hypothetical protein
MQNREKVIFKNNSRGLLPDQLAVPPRFGTVDHGVSRITSGVLLET